MTVPVITAGSFVQSSTLADAAQTINLPVSTNSNRIWVFGQVSKDNSPVAELIDTLIFDAAGVNRSIGAGITHVSSNQIAQEGDFSSQCDIWICKDADGPVSGSKTVAFTMDGSCQYLFVFAYEINGARQDALDAVTNFVSLDDVTAGNPYSKDHTTIRNDALVIGHWGQSDSAAPTITPLGSETQLGSNFSETNGGGNCSWINKASAGVQNMGQTTSTLSQRQAGIIISVTAPPSSGSFTDCKRFFYEGLGYVGSNSDMELAWLVSQVVSPKGNTRRDLWHQYLIEQSVPDGQLNDMLYVWLGGLGHVGSLNDRWMSYWGC